MYIEIYRPDYGSASTWERLTGGTGSLRDWLSALPVYLLVGLACAAQYLLALVGARRVLAPPKGVTVLLLISGVYFLFMAGAVGNIATARMRHAAMPAICVLAGFGASSARARYWPRRPADSTGPARRHRPAR